VANPGRAKALTGKAEEKCDGARARTGKKKGGRSLNRVRTRGGGGASVKGENQETLNQTYSSYTFLKAHRAAQAVE